MLTDGLLIQKQFASPSFQDGAFRQKAVDLLAGAVGGQGLCRKYLPTGKSAGVLVKSPRALALVFYFLNCQLISTGAVSAFRLRPPAFTTLKGGGDGNRPPPAAVLLAALSRPFSSTVRPAPAAMLPRLQIAQRSGELKILVQRSIVGSRLPAPGVLSARSTISRAGGAHGGAVVTPPTLSFTSQVPLFWKVPVPLITCSSGKGSPFLQFGHYLEVNTGGYGHIDHVRRPVQHLFFTQGSSLVPLAARQQWVKSA